MNIAFAVRVSFFHHFMSLLETDEDEVGRPQKTEKLLQID